MAFRSCKSVSPIFHFICDTLIHHRINRITPTFVRFFETQSIANNSNFTEKQAFTVSYLTKSCGLSLETAISASKKINIKSTVKSDSVLELLRSHGFTENHISRLFSTYPKFILADPEGILRPKIEYFESLGIFGPDLPSCLCSSSILQGSLENRIKPTINFLKQYISTNEDLIRALKQSSGRCSTEKVMLPNIYALRAHGVPESHIGKLFMLQPRALTVRVDVFKEITDAVKEMGFDPKSRSYLLAVRAMSTISKLNWEKKKEAYMSFGWSESQFNSAFKVQPGCMLTSEKKIKKLMDFFVNKAGLRASDTAKCPNLFLTSLERRIIPRCSVLQVLMSKGLIRKDVEVVWVLICKKKIFETRFLTKYKEVAPEVIKAYKGEIGFQGFNTRS